MLTVKPVYKLLNVSDDLKWTTKHVTIFTRFQGKTLFAPSFFYPSTHVSTRPYSFIPFQWTGLSLHKAMSDID